MWYSGHMWTLWVLLLALPFAGMVTGCGTLLREWNRDLEKGAPLIMCEFASNQLSGNGLSSTGQLSRVRIALSLTPFPFLYS